MKAQSAFLLALAVLITPPAAAQTPGPAGSPPRLTVLSRVRPTACYVGEAVELTVGVVGEAERPDVTAPKVDGVDVALVGTDLRPLSASGIGDAVWSKNLYRFHFRLVPRRSGVRTIPPVRARLGDRAGASAPARLEVRPVPAEGRPASFLGGVGEFDVEAAAVPASVRTGEAFEYRVTVTGPAAWGSLAAPALDRLAKVPLGLRVERLPDVEADDPPSRTFVFRVRATRPGSATLPPVVVSAFEPESHQYLTRATAGVPVRVAEVPRFDPSTVAGSWAEAEGTRGIDAGAVAAVAAATLAAAGLALAWGRRRRDPGRAARRSARGVAEALARAADASTRGRVITDGLAEYLRLTTGRPPGALTPDEAEEGVARATGRAELGRRAGTLVASCDEARFGRVEGAGDRADGLTGAGSRFFLELAGTPPLDGPETRAAPKTR